MEIRLCLRCRRVRGDAATCPECRDHLVLVDPDYFVGWTFGKYHIDSVLGAGGMGVVYRARHAELEKAVALKLLVPEAKHGDFVKRFRNEAKVLATLKHPHIVEVFDLDIAEAGLPYYVMQLLEGQSLRAQLAGHPKGLPLPLFQRFARQIGSALAYTHGKGIIHRDLKPENIFVEEVDGRAVLKVLDFGIAKMVAPDAEASTMTQTGLILGTPHYMAPEQITGLEMGPHTDQYAFALICWEMLTGRAARQGKTVGEIISQEVRRPLTLEELPQGGIQERFGPVLARATDPDHRKRYPSVQVFTEALCDEGEMETGKTRASGMAAPRPGRGRRRPLWKWAAALLLLLLAAAGTWMAGRGAPGPASAPLPREDFLAALDAFPVPPGAEALLDAPQGILLRGADGLHYLDPANPALPARYSLEPGESLAADLPQGLLALQKGRSLVLADYAGKRRKERVRFALPAEGTVAAVSPSGSAYALTAEGSVAIHRAGRTSPTRLEGSVSPRALFRMGERVFAAADEGTLRVWNLAGGAPLLRTPIPASGVGALALLEEAGLAAVGGWFDEVIVADFRSGRTEAVLLPGQTHALRFIPDAPSLLIAKNDTVHLWRPKEGIVADFRSDGARFTDARFTAAGLLALDTAHQRVHRLAYPGFPLRDALATGGAELWALASPADGGLLYAGGSDGKLYVADPAKGVVSPHELHTQGITALLWRDGVLASASDDKTIALWKLPSLQVFWRSQAHEYLINALHFSPSSGTLWSSSSDGKIKVWRWPQLAGVEEIVTGAGNHASLWVNDDETLILAGTWRNMLAVLEKEGGGWRAAQVFRVPCDGVYSSALLPAARMAILNGVQPGAVFAYDLDHRTLHRLPDLGLGATWTLPVSPEAAVVTGAGGLLRYTVRRGDGTARVAVALAVNPRVGTIGAASLLPSDTLALGTARGEIFFADLAAVPFRDIATVELDLPLEPALTDAPLPFRLGE